MMDKKIRIDYYQFRIKKGRADVLLQKEAEGQRYCVPFYYMQAKDRIRTDFLFRNMEDDGDMVFNSIKLNNCHLKKKNREWFPLDRLLDLSLSRNESFHIWHNILRFFLSVCPREEETTLFRKAETMLDDVLVRGARMKYMEMLQGVLDGKPEFYHCFNDAFLTPADPALVRREMESFEHFRLQKPKIETESMQDIDKLYGEEYSYEPVDPAVFGCTMVLIPISGEKSIISESCDPPRKIILI